MALSLISRLTKRIENWLTKEDRKRQIPMCDFERIRYEIRPCDVLLVEGRSKVSEVIRLITLSSWSHAALYIGRVHDIENPILRERFLQYYKGEPDKQLLIESVLGKGTVVTPIEEYEHDHIRICRPRGISRQDAQRVIGYAIGKLGWQYDVRQIFDLARFFFPWGILPRRWRSSLFTHNVGGATRIVCSSMLAEAFGSIKFPILPLVKKHSKTGVEFVRRNPRLYTPRDFDYSPYFEIIKYPFINLAEQGMYRYLPWSKEAMSNDDYRNETEISSTEIDKDEYGTDENLATEVNDNISSSDKQKGSTSPAKKDIKASQNKSP